MRSHNIQGKDVITTWPVVLYQQDRLEPLLAKVWNICYIMNSGRSHCVSSQDQSQDWSLPLIEPGRDRQTKVGKFLSNSFMKSFYWMTRWTTTEHQGVVDPLYLKLDEQVTPMGSLLVTPQADCTDLDNYLELPAWRH